jgi:hypothetical protein
MKQTRAVSGYQIARQSIALTLSVLLIPFASGNLNAQGGAYAPLDPVALDQLVAPIALYPDSLVAQILTASTYPQQVSDADAWSQQNAGMPPQQRADIANGMPWDPSVKALTAFPTVLDNLARNANWTSSLGNAYYNQPGDVMNAVQAARVQAQQAGYLRSTPQERVVYEGGLITIVPVNPEVVYVPYYNPWRIYGGWVSPYAGFYVAPPPFGVALGLGIGFAAVGISIGLFGHYGWGYHSWEPNWRGGVVVYNHNTYISNSRTVYNSGHFGGYNRGVFEHGGPGVPANFRPPVTNATASFTRGGNVDRPAPGAFNRPAPAGGFNRPAGGANEGRPAPGAFNRPATGANEGRPAPGAFNRPAPGAVNRPAPAAAARPAGGEFSNRPLTLQHSPAAAARAQGARPAEAPRAQAPRAEAARPAPRAEAGGNRPQAHAAPARPAPQQGHAEGHEHK